MLKDSPSTVKGKGISGFPLKVLQSLRDSLISMYDDLTQS